IGEAELVGVGDQAAAIIAEAFGAPVRIGAAAKAAQEVESTRDRDAVGVSGRGWPVFEVIDDDLLFTEIIADDGAKALVIVEEVSVSCAVGGCRYAVERIEPICYRIIIRVGSDQQVS